MASRKEQKEALRKEREAREAAAAAEARRRRLIGYAAGGAVALVAVVVAVVLLASGGGGESKGKADDSSNVLPGGGSVPEQKVTDIDQAAKAAGCELKSYPGKSREHTGDPSEKIKYDSDPPTEGKHFQVPAEDGAYETSPEKSALVHTLEHGRVIIWFKKSLPTDDRAGLKKLFDDDSYHMVLTPDDTMKYAVAATAWNRGGAQELGTGRLLGCTNFTPAVYDALRAFRDEHRDNGPENVP